MLRVGLGAGDAVRRQLALGMPFIFSLMRGRGTTVSIPFRRQYVVKLLAASQHGLCFYFSPATLATVVSLAWYHALRW